MWRGMAVLFPLQSQCSVAALPVVVTHRRFPSSSAYTGKQTRCHGFTGMCMGMWGVSTLGISGTPHQHNMTRKKKYCAPFWVTRFPRSSMRVCFIYSRKHCWLLSCFELGQVYYMFRKFSTDSKVSTMLLFRWLIFFVFFDLQEQSPQENKEVVSTQISYSLYLPCKNVILICFIIWTLTQLNALC